MEIIELWGRRYEFLYRCVSHVNGRDAPTLRKEDAPPEPIAEIAHSSAAYDLHDKRRAYRRNGVQEQIVCQIEEQQDDWFISEGGSDLSFAASEDGRIASRTFPGLVLDVEALLETKYDTVLAALLQ